jgi:hypothetical protein
VNSDGSTQQENQSVAPESRGYGPLEYAIIFGLVALVVAFTWLVVGNDVRAWVGSLFIREEPPVTQFSIVELDRTAEKLEQEVISVSNCGNDEAQEFEVNRDRSFEHIIFFPQDISEELARQISDKMFEEYGFLDGQVVDRRYRIHASASAGSHADFTIEWQEDWREGEVIVIPPEGEEERYPYQLLNDLEFVFLGSEENPCEP